MSQFDSLRQEIENGIAGKNNAVPMGFHRLNKYVSIRKRIYTLIFGATGSGKSALAHSAFILNPFDWWIANKHTATVKPRMILFSMERSVIYIIAKWTVRKVFLDRGIYIPVNKLLGWWDEKLTKDEHDLVMMYEDYINELTEMCTIIPGAQNPTGIYKYAKAFAAERGREEHIDEFNKVYIPNDENEIVIPIIDHIALTKQEKGLNKKEAIDRVSENLQYYRDFYGWAPVVVSQMNRDFSSVAAFSNKDMEPTLDHVKESGRPAEDADAVISLFQPHRYKLTDSQYKTDKFVNPETGTDYFRKLKVLKNTYGDSDIGIGMAFMGAIGEFSELPTRNQMEEFDYTTLFDNSYFLK